jgi:hypothetical protein
MTKTNGTSIEHFWAFLFYFDFIGKKCEQKQRPAAIRSDSVRGTGAPASCAVPLLPDDIVRNGRRRPECHLQEWIRLGEAIRQPEVDDPIWLTGNVF